MDSIRILGVDIPIQKVDFFPGDKDQLGGSDRDGIKILSTLPERSRETVLLHEIIEEINSRLELNLTHTQICGIETGLFTVYRENNLDMEEAH